MPPLGWRPQSDRHCIAADEGEPSGSLLGTLPHLSSIRAYLSVCVMAGLIKLLVFCCNMFRLVCRCCCYLLVFEVLVHFTSDKLHKIIKYNNIHKQKQYKYYTIL